MSTFNQGPWRFAPLVALFCLTGCTMVSPTMLGLPNLGTLPGSTVTVTGDMAARQATVQPIVRRQASAQQLPTGLVMAVIEQESAFQAKAVSPAGAQGLMQLMPATVEDINARAPKIHIDDAFDPEQNVAGGCWYLAWLHEALNAELMAPGEDWKFALASYNGGIGRVQEAISQAYDGSETHQPVTFDAVAEALPAETQSYVPAVMGRWSKYGD